MANRKLRPPIAIVERARFPPTSFLGPRSYSKRSTVGLAIARKKKFPMTSRGLLSMSENYGRLLAETRGPLVEVKGSITRKCRNWVLDN